MLLVAVALGARVARAQPTDAGAPASAVSGLPEALTPRIQTKLAPTGVSVGEVATLTIEVDAPTSVSVSLPEQPFGALELADRRLRSEAQGERTRTVFELDLLALEPGELEVPALTLRLLGPSGELGEAHTRAEPLTVRSLIANEPNAEAKPASKPIAVMRDDYTLAWVGLGLLGAALVAGATLLASRWWRQRPKAPEPLPPPRPAWDVAFEKLERLATQKDQLLAEERGVEFIDGVSDALREYLGLRYGFDGLERTTGEIVGTLEKLRPPQLSLSGVALLLDQCDLVKFARATPDDEQCDDLLNGAFGLVRSTIPVTNPGMTGRFSAVSAEGRVSMVPPPGPRESLLPPPPRGSLLPPPPRDSLLPPPARPAAAPSPSAPAAPSASEPKREEGRS